MISFNKIRYFHIFAIAILSVYYVFSLIFFGVIIIDPYDNLDVNVVYNHIISKVYSGQFESIKIFLSGEFKWYFLDEIFHPINIFHLILNDKQFHFFEEILKKILSYLSFYILAKSLLKNRLHCIFGALFFATAANTILPSSAYGICILPYFLYLLTTKEIFKLKHYILIFLAGLNSSIIHDYLALVLLIPLAFFLTKEKRFFGAYIKYFIIITFAVLLISTPLFLSLLNEDLQRVEFFKSDYIAFFLVSIKGAFRGLTFTNISSIYQIPKEILYIFLVISSLFLKNKKGLLIATFIFLVFFTRTVVGSNIIDIFFENMFVFLKGFNFTRIDKILPLLFSLLLIYNLSYLRSENYKKIIYTLVVVSSISLQLAIPQTELIKQFFENNLKKEKFLELKNLINIKELNSASKLITKKSNYIDRDLVFQFKSEKSFDNYYRFSDYRIIKSLVKDKRVMSIGLDPMIAAMNDIKVIDGYYTVYPLSYKIKFRKIIEKELEKNIKLKNYYDRWGSRVYAFYNDEKNIMLNFQSAKTLGADYVISKFPIKNNDLKIICSECNNSDDIFLYEIL